MLVFACLSPHPPIILPTIGSEPDRAQVKKTMDSLERLAKELANLKPDSLIISSPHPDWGFNVPLHFLLPHLEPNPPIRTYLTDSEPPVIHFQRGREIVKNFDLSSGLKRVAWIASGDMSHRLKEEGPYGFHPCGPRFDEKFIELLKKKDIQGILSLNPPLIEEAGECGLRSFCMLLGAIDETKVDWQPEILSYEYPFGVGYLVADIRINTNKK